MGQVDRCRDMLFHAAKPDTPEPSVFTGDQPKDALAVRLARDPELAEVASVWKLLDEPIRQAILALVRVKARD